MTAMRYEYLKSVLHPPVWISVPSHDNGDSDAPLTFWYISSSYTYNKNMKTVPTFCVEDEMPETPFNLCAQTAE